MSRYTYSAYEELMQLKIAIIYFILGNMTMGCLWMAFHFYG